MGETTINLVTLLEADLRTLSNQASNKKHADIRAACQRALALLGSAATPSVTTAAVLHPLLLVLRPLTKSTTDRSMTKMQTTAASCLNTVMTNGELSAARVVAVLTTLLALCPDVQQEPINSKEASASEPVLMPSDDVCTKVLQTLAALVSQPAIAKILHGRALWQAFAIAMRLFARGSQAICVRAASTLPVMISVVLQGAAAEYSERAAAAAAAAAGDETGQDEKKTEAEKNEPPPSPRQFAAKAAAIASAAGAAAAEEEGKRKISDLSDIVEGDPKSCEGNSLDDACGILRDFCSLARGEQPTAVAVSAVDVCFALQMLEYAMQQYSKLFVSCTPLRQLLVREICPTIIALFHGTSQFRLCAQLVRTSYAFITSFYETLPDEAVVLFAKICKLVDPDVPAPPVPTVSSGKRNASSHLSSSSAAANQALVTKQWQQALVLEVLRPLLIDKNIVFALFNNSDGKMKLQQPNQKDNEGKSEKRSSRKLKSPVKKSSKSKDDGASDEEQDDDEEEAAATGEEEEEEDEEEEEEDEEEEEEEEEEETPRSSVDEGSKELGIFATVVGHFAQIIQKSNAHVWQAFALADSTPAPRSRLVEQHDALTAPPLKPTYLTSCALSCLLALVHTFRVASISPDPTFQLLLESTWPSMLGGLTTVLENSIEEGVVQALTKAYEMLVTVYGSMQVDTPRDAFLTSLVKFVLLPSAMSTLPVPFTQATYNAAASASPQSPAFAVLEPYVAAYKESFQNAAECANYVHRALIAKGVTTTKALMSLMHGAGNNLGDGWKIVLSTLENLHRCEVLLGVNAVLPCDDNETALTSLFECSCHLTHQSLLTLFSHIFQLSDDLLKQPCTDAAPPQLRAAIPASKNQSKQLIAKLSTYFASRAVLIAKYNVDRSDIFFNDFFRFVLANINSSNPEIRSVLTSSFGEMLHAILLRGYGGTRRTATQAVTLGESAEEGDVLPAEEEGEVLLPSNGPGVSVRCDAEYRSSSATLLNMQDMLFESALKLLETMTATDSHLTLLADMHKAIQASGHHITTAWPGVLAILEAAAKLPDKQAVIVQSFQTVLLVSTDYLSCLQSILPAEPESKTGEEGEEKEACENDCMSNYIRIVSLYAHQTDHMNISLSSEDIMWAVSSHLSKTLASCEGDEAQKEECGRLSLQLMNTLKQLSCDDRADVRNSSMTILFRIVTSYPQLYDYEACVWEVLFPMLDSVKLRAMTYDSKIVTMPQRPEKKEEERRTSDTNKVNDDGDEAHQWALSVVLAFESMSRVVKLSAEREKDTPRFGEEWTRLCNFIRDSSSDLRTAEVAETGLATLHVLSSRAAELRLQKSFWLTCFDCIRVVVRLISERPPRHSTGQCLATLVASWTLVLHDCADYFDSDEVCDMCNLISPLALLFVDDYTERMGLTCVQLAVSAFLTGVTQLPDTVAARTNELICLVLETFAAYPVKAAGVIPQRVPGGKEELQWRALITFVTTTSKSLVEAFNDPKIVNDDVRVACATNIARSLGDGMLVRYKLCVAQIPQQLNVQIWKLCMNTFSGLLTSLSTALSGAATAAPNDPGQKTSEAWLCVISVCNEFLFPKTQQILESAPSASSQPSEPQSSLDAAENDKTDAALLEVLVDCYLRHGTDSALDSRYSDCDTAMVNLCAMGSPAAEQGRDGLCCSCFHGMFQLASIERSHETLIAMAAPVMLKRSVEVAEQYLQKDSENLANEAGIVAHSLFLQLRCVLREATMLETHLPNNAHPFLENCPFETSTRKHAIVLYPLLCELVTVQDSAVKPEIKGLMKLVGSIFFNCSAKTN